MTHETRLATWTGIVFSALVGSLAGLLLAMATAQGSDAAPAPTPRTRRPVTPPALPLPLPKAAPVIVAVPHQRATSALAAPGMVLTVSAAAPPFVAAAEVVSKRGKLSLAWDRSPDASVTGYRLYFGTNDGVGPWTLSATVGNVTNATLTGLDEGTRYYVTAVAYNAGGLESTHSNEASGVTPIYISLTTQCWQVSAFGLLGRTNMIQASTNLTTWQTILTWVGNGQLTNVLHVNREKSWFRVEAKP